MSKKRVEKHHDSKWRSSRQDIISIKLMSGQIETSIEKDIISIKKESHGTMARF